MSTDLWNLTSDSLGFFSLYQDAGWFEQYTWALFKALSHMLCIGYGRFPPNSLSEAWMTAISMMAGATCYAIVVGHAAALIQSFDVSKRRYRDKMKQVEEYMSYRKLPRKLRRKIVDYYEHRYNGKCFNEKEIMQEISECLRDQIINFNCRALVASVPFFSFGDENFVSDVLRRLQFEVFQPGDAIIKQGTCGTKMYFVREGTATIIDKDGSILDTFSEGTYFGALSLYLTAMVVEPSREFLAYYFGDFRASGADDFASYPLVLSNVIAVLRLQAVQPNVYLVGEFPPVAS
ncbi:unnamed protein product [Schistocephalus solidus]|uniref:Cyclic nucleotide-binding domain-containing protein n=1 Tax=Schistocephalus solidus TaxID=70667 RepID=A0A183SMJ6_SCHSO|nr:unnamed protein product [Schistocephalus solidus]